MYIFYNFLCVVPQQEEAAVVSAEPGVAMAAMELQVALARGTGVASAATEAVSAAMVPAISTCRRVFANNRSPI